jgi:tight adherence protein B
MRSTSREQAKLYQQILLAALGMTTLLGVALFRVLRTERRRAIFELRLKGIAMPTPIAGKLEMSLRKPARQRRPLLARLDPALAATGNRIGVPHLAASGIVAASVIGLAAALTQLPPALAAGLGGAGAVAGPAVLLQLAQSRYQRQFLDLFPDALDLIVRAVRAGLPAPEAIELAAREVPAPVGSEFRRMLDETRIGVEMEDALQAAADRIRVPDFRFFVVSLLLQRRTGGGIAETLSTLSTIIRQRKAVRLKARALTAEARASALVVAVLPFVAGGGLFLINRDLMSVLFVDPRGRLMLGIACISLLLGVAAMKTIIRSNLR